MIYVVGHGSPGSDYISSSNSKKAKSLDYNAIAERLVKSGLSKSFSGAIKFYSCHSATKKGNKCFAESCAFDLWDLHEITQAMFFGYHHSVSGTYGYRDNKDKILNGEKHRYATEYKTVKKRISKFFCIPIFMKEIRTTKHGRAFENRKQIVF